MEDSKLTKTQKLQIKNESEKCLSLCKKKAVAKSFVSLDPDKNQDIMQSFPKYKANHPGIQNASGTFFKVLPK